MKTNIMIFLISASLVGTCLAQSMGGGSTSSGNTSGVGSSTSGGSSPTTNSDNYNRMGNTAY